MARRPAGAAEAGGGERGLRIAYAGLPGAFAHQACLAFAPDHEPFAVPGFADVIRAVETGEAELGALPVENSRAGAVTEAATLIAVSKLRTVAEHDLPVRMHLLALPGARLEDLTAIVSHPVALAQCREFLASLGLPTENGSNTAAAAAALRDRTKGVLASESAA